MTQGPDADLIARFLKGDESAFDALYARYRKNLYSYAYSLVGNLHDAQESVQSAWLGWLSRCDALGAGVAFRAYIYRSVRNACFDVIRGRRVTLPEGDVWIKPRDPLVDMETAQQVQQAVRTLPDDQRETVVLRAIQGMEFAEIAEVTDVPEKTARSRWRLALERMKHQLSRTQ